MEKRSWHEQSESFEQYKVKFKFKKCCSAIMSYLRGGKGNSKKKILSIKNEIEKLKKDPNNFNFPELRILRKELGQAYKDDEPYWKQKSRALWLQEGDKKYFFFHMKTIQRRNCNRIKGSCLDNGNWVSARGDIIREVEIFYEKLLVHLDHQIWLLF